MLYTRAVKPLNFNIIETFPMTQQLLLPEWVVPVIPHGLVLTKHAIAIDQNGLIDAILPIDQALDRFPNWQRVDLPGQVVTPGLINLHTHAAMSLLRGAADDLPLERWLNDRIWPLEGKLLSEDFVFDGSVLAIREMLLGGTTTFNDMYFFQEATAKAALAMGIRANLSVAVLEFPTPYGSSAADYLRKGLAVRDQFRGESKLSFSLAPHAPYSVSDQTFKQIAHLSGERALGIHCHIPETTSEIAQSVAQYGMRPIARLDQLGVIGSELIAAHCVHMSGSEIELFAKHGVTIAHCPHSNLKLASGIAPIAALLDQGVRIGIGTDGSASNNRLDLLSEGRCAALLAKGASQNAQIMNAAQTLAAMTIHAAQALGLSDQIGSIEPGKCADLVSFDLSDLSTQPVFDPIAQLIFATGREQVDSVWIKGRPVVLKRQLVEASAQRVLAEVTPRVSLWHNRAGEILSAAA